MSDANDTIYGLAAYFYSYPEACLARGRGIGMWHGWRQHGRLRKRGPFWAMQQSGIGQEGSHHGLEDYLETNCMGGI
ncbi:MAG: aldehyde dehydrogenase family protein [Mesorhizobium sp.]|nr:MAG: aldehyde dehydrogenase family protein [Mesorhizobium sp.]